MLAERIEGWFDEAERKGLEQGLKKGLEQGLEKGERMALRRLLDKRFGSLPEAIEAHLDTASLEQIEAWFDKAIDAASLDEVFGTH